MKRAENHPQPAWSAELVELYGSHFGRFVYQAQRIVCDHALAEECVQDVFLAYHSKRPTHDPSRTVAYLRTMVRNAAISMVRSEVRRRDAAEASQHPPAACAPSPEDIVVAEHAAEDILGQLERLPGRQLQVIDCRLGGMDVAATADVLQISSGSVKTHRFRARNALRHLTGVADAA